VVARLRLDRAASPARPRTGQAGAAGVDHRRVGRRRYLRPDAGRRPVRCVPVRYGVGLVSTVTSTT
jgi:hypothetical protein